MTKYTLGPIKQLIDINGPLLSFKSSFSIKSSNGKQFEGVVVSQTQLDNDPSIQYKKSNEQGEFRGEITYDKGEYQSFYLLLKAVEAVEVDVTINTIEIPSQPNPPSIPPPPAPTPVTTDDWKAYIPTILWAIAGLSIFYYIWSNWSAWFGSSSTGTETSSAIPITTQVSVPKANLSIPSSPASSSSPIRLNYRKSSVRRRKSTPYNPSPSPSTVVSSVSGKSGHSGKDLFGKLDKL